MKKLSVAVMILTVIFGLGFAPSFSTIAKEVAINSTTGEIPPIIEIISDLPDVDSIKPVSVIVNLPIEDPFGWGYIKIRQVVDNRAMAWQDSPVGAFAVMYHESFGINFSYPAGIYEIKVIVITLKTYESDIVSFEIHQPKVMSAVITSENTADKMVLFKARIVAENIKLRNVSATMIVACQDNPARRIEKTLGELPSADYNFEPEFTTEELKMLCQGKTLVCQVETSVADIGQKVEIISFPPATRNITPVASDKITDATP